MFGGVCLTAVDVVWGHSSLGFGFRFLLDGGFGGLLVGCVFPRWVLGCGCYICVGVCSVV